MLNLVLGVGVFSLNAERKRFRRFRFRVRFLGKRFRRFRFPVPVRFLSHITYSPPEYFRQYSDGMAHSTPPHPLWQHSFLKSLRAQTGPDPPLRNGKSAQRVSFGAGYPADVHADIPADVRGQKLRSSPRNPGKTSIWVRTSMAEFSFPNLWRTPAKKS